MCAQDEETNSVCKSLLGCNQVAWDSKIQALAEGDFTESSI